MTALVLAPGASATRDHPGLVSVDDAVRAALAGRIDAVERIDLPKGKAERAVPAVVAAVRRLVRDGGHDRVFLGGRSFGGRVCSMAVASGEVPVPGSVVGGLVLVSYPLHPPGKPDQLRTEHFPSLHVPCLFVSGTRDAFIGSSPDAMVAATTAIPGPVTHVWVEGGDHGLRRKDAEVAAAVIDWIGSTIGDRG